MAVLTDLEDRAHVDADIVSVAVLIDGWVSGDLVNDDNASINPYLTYTSTKYTYQGYSKALVQLSIFPILPSVAYTLYF